MPNAISRSVQRYTIVFVYKNDQNLQLSPYQNENVDRVRKTYSKLRNTWSSHPEYHHQNRNPTNFLRSLENAPLSAKWDKKKKRGYYTNIAELYCNTLKFYVS